MDRKIPSTMVSQHPDHSCRPFWHTEEFISTQQESLECFLSYSELGVSEYKWDWEGKLVDEAVLDRLYGEHYNFFRKRQLGRDIFLTFRLPNPKVETEFRLGRAFMGIISAAGLAKQLGLHSPPLFEVILPMTENSTEMIEIHEAYTEVASLKHHLLETENGLKHIEVIPLFEQVEKIISSDRILEKYVSLHKKKFGFNPSYIRPYMARSDPALNSGLVPTVLAIKVALSRYKKFEQRFQLPLYPIIGTGSLVFRGGLTPDRVDDFLNEYQGVKTALLQSAFRYDYEKNIVKKAIKKLDKNLPILKARDVDSSNEEKIKSVIELFEKEYKKSVEKLAPLINEVAQFLPKRRERVLHVGLFGYARGVGAVKLPRAISFTGALYSIGIPPEIIGTGRGLKKVFQAGSIDVVKKFYLNLRNDLIKTGVYVNKENIKKLSHTNTFAKEILEDIVYIEKYMGIELGPNSYEHRLYKGYTKTILNKIKGKRDNLQKVINQAAVIRRSLG